MFAQFYNESHNLSNPSLFLKMILFSAVIFGVCSTSGGKAGACGYKVQSNKNKYVHINPIPDFHRDKGVSESVCMCVLVGSHPVHVGGLGFSTAPALSSHQAR